MFYLNKAIEIDPENGELFYQLGNIYYTNSDYQNAIDNYSVAIQHNSNLENTFHNRGLAYVQVEEYDLAKRDFESLLRLTTDKDMIATANLMISKLE